MYKHSAAVPLPSASPHAQGSPHFFLINRSTSPRLRIGTASGNGRWSCVAQLQSHKGKGDNLFLVQIIYFSLNVHQSSLCVAKGTSLTVHFICFLFPANPPDLEIHPVALVVGAVSRVICMDAVWCGGRGRNLHSHPVFVPGEFIFYGSWLNWFLWNTLECLQIWKFL